MPTCLPNTRAIDRPDPPTCDVHEMSPAPTLLQNWKSRANFTVLILIVALAWTVEMAGARSHWRSHSPVHHVDKPSFFIECDDYEDDYSDMRRRRSLESELSMLNEKTPQTTSARPNYKHLNRELERENKRLEEESSRLKIKRNKLKIRLRNMRKKLKRWKKKRLRQNHLKFSNNWHCEFRQKNYTTRGYPEIIKTGTCSGSTCMNHFYMCAEVTYLVPYLQSMTKCIDYKVRTGRHSHVVKKVRFYKFSEFKAVVGCNCVLNPDTQ